MARARGYKEHDLIRCSSHPLHYCVLRYRNLIEALEAGLPGERPFVTAWVNEDEQETVTFAEFRRRARLQAGVLRANGVTAGDRVIIIMPQGILAMTVFVAAMMLGAVPAFIAYPNDKVEPSKYRFGVAGVTANLSAKVVAIDEEFPDEMLGHVSLGEETRLLRVGSGSGREEKILPLPSQRDGVAFIQHSAGTTGLQKGVALTHTAVLRQLAHLSQVLKIDSATDRIYSWLPLYHDMGLIACFMLPMVCHIPLVMQSPLDWVMHPETMLQVISEHRCTRRGCLTLLFSLFLASPGRTGARSMICLRFARWSIVRSRSGPAACRNSRMHSSQTD